MAFVRTDTGSTIVANHRASGPMGVASAVDAETTIPTSPKAKRKRTTKSVLKGISKTSRPAFKKKPGEIRQCVLGKGSKWPQISSKGRFRSTRGVVTRPKPATNGYVSVSIQGSSYQLHALICRSFHGPAPTANHTTDHIDNNPSNNNVENLRWLTKSEQIQHSYATNPERESNAARQSKPVKGRKVGDDEWILYDSANSAARELSLNQGNISRVCQGKVRKTGGYEFCFDKPKETDTLPGEEWRDVVSGDGPYEVSDLAERMGSWPQVSNQGQVPVYSGSSDSPQASDKWVCKRPDPEISLPNPQLELSCVSRTSTDCQAHHRSH